MGFQPKRRVYELDFAGTDLDGLTVTARSAPIGMVMKLGESVEAFDAVPEAADVEGMTTAAQLAMVAQSMGKLSGIVDMYAGVLVGWDLLDDTGEPVPATRAGMLTLDPAHLMLIIRAWQQAVAAVPAPLAGPSSSGGPSLVASLPMDVLSPSLAS